MTAFTSTQTGNWNSAATWGGGGFPSSSGDTATITGQHVVTIPFAISILCGAITVGAGSGSNYTKLVNLGSLKLAGAFAAQGTTKVEMGPSAVFDLDGNTATSSGGNTYWNFIGSVGSRCVIKSTTWGGSFKITAYAKTIFDWQHFDLSGLADSELNASHASYTVAPSWQHGSVTDCNQLYWDIWGADVGEMLISDISFRSPHSATPVGSAAGLVIWYDAATGSPSRRIEHCTWDTAGAQSQTIELAHGVGITFDDCVFNEVRINEAGSSDRYLNCFFSGGAKDPIGQQQLFASANWSNFAGNYTYYTQGGHPFPLAGGTNPIVDCVFEQGGNGVGANWFLAATLPSAGTLNIKRNLFIGNGGIPVSITGACTYALLDFSNNTYYGGMNGIGMTPPNEQSKGLTSEQSGVYAGTVNVYNNLLVSSAAFPNADPLINLQSGAAGQITLSDYNVQWQPAGASVPPVLYTPNAITGGAANGHDFAVDPHFVAPTRTLATWDSALDGPGTAANAIAEMLKMNGTGGTYNAAYSPSALVTWVRAGFVPVSSALIGTGRNGGNIGAETPVADGRRRGCAPSFCGPYIVPAYIR